jgi:hypothetical protein
MRVLFRNGSPGEIRTLGFEGCEFWRARLPVLVARSLDLNPYGSKSLQVRQYLKCKSQMHKVLCGYRPTQSRRRLVKVHTGFPRKPKNECQSRAHLGMGPKEV